VIERDDNIVVPLFDEIMNESASPLLEWQTVFGYTALAAFVTWQVVTRPLAGI
jgi:hypothetical protein